MRADEADAGRFFVPFRRSQTRPVVAWIVSVAIAAWTVIVPYPTAYANPTPRAGEITLTGTVQRVDASTGTVQLLAMSVAFSDGENIPFAAPRPKLILIDDATRLLDLNARSISLDRLAVGAYVDVVGTDHGRGQPVTAREIDVESRPAPTAMRPIARVRRAPPRLGADLIQAASNGDLGRVKSLIGTGLGLNPVDQWAYTPLQRAISRGHDDCAAALIAAGADVNVTGWQGQTALMFAVERHDDAMARVLISAGANVNAAQHAAGFGETAMMIAVRLGATACLKAVIDAGANVNATNTFGSTALKQLAMQTPTPDPTAAATCVQLLVDAGASDVDAAFNAAMSYDPYRSPNAAFIRAVAAAAADKVVNLTPLMVAAIVDQPDRIKSLIAGGADPNGTSPKYGWTSLQFASVAGNADSVSALLAAGVTVDGRDSSGETALMHAAGSGQTACVEALLQAGADPNAGDVNQSTALIRAAAMGRTGCVSALLVGRADVNQRDHLGNSALLEACDSFFAPTDNLDVVRTLLSAGANPNVENNLGETALFAAQSRPAVVQALLTAGAVHNHAAEMLQKLCGAACFGADAVRATIAAGADVNAKTPIGETALFTAANAGNVSSIKALIVAGADVNAKTVDGDTALMDAAQDGNVDCVNALITGGADVNAFDSQGMTALMRVALWGRGDRAVIVRAFAINRANLNAIDNNGETALYLAANMGRVDVVQALVNAGADQSIRSRNGQTPLDCATVQGHLDCAVALKSAGPPP